MFESIVIMQVYFTSFCGKNIPFFFFTFFSPLWKPYFPHASPYIFLQYEWEGLLKDQASSLWFYHMTFSFPLISTLSPAVPISHLRPEPQPARFYRFALKTVSQSEQVTIFISGGCDLVNTAILEGKESERKIYWISSIMRCDTY